MRRTATLVCLIVVALLAAAPAGAAKKHCPRALFTRNGWLLTKIYLIQANLKPIWAALKALSSQIPPPMS